MATTPYFALLTIPLTLLIVAKEIDISITSVMLSAKEAYETTR